jgi:hypothetical protein
VTFPPGTTVDTGVFGSMLVAFLPGAQPYAEISAADLAGGTKSIEMPFGTGDAMCVHDYVSATASNMLGGCVDPPADPATCPAGPIALPIPALVGGSTLVTTKTPSPECAVANYTVTRLSPTSIRIAGLHYSAVRALSLDDRDSDGCPGADELGPNEAEGGLRNPNSFWDFMDQWTGGVRDKVVAGGDIGAVVARFGSSGNANGDPLTPPASGTGYHTIADRNGAFPGGYPWDLQPPNGSVSGGDIGAVVAQFGHSCA